MSSSGLGIAWRLTNGMYEPEFRAYVERTMGDLKLAGPQDRTAQWRSVIESAARGEGGVA